MKKYLLLFLLTVCPALAANEIVVKNQTPSLTNLYVVVEQQGTKYLLNEGTPSWDSTPTTGEWGNYDIALTEDAVLVGSYYATMPAISAGMVRVNLFQGSSPAYNDTRIDSVSYYWTGTYLLDPAAVLTVESTDATTYVESRTLPIASYATAASQTTVEGKVDTVDALVDTLVGEVVYATVNAVTDTRVFTITGGNIDTDTDLADAIVVAIDATDGKKSFGTVRTYSALTIKLDKGLSFTPENGDVIYFLGN